MQVFTAFGQDQVGMAVNLFEWIHELDGRLAGHTCLLLTDRTMSGQEAEPVVKSAREVFDNVEIIRPNVQTPKGWPFAQNLMFQTAASWAHAKGKNPFLWLETDAIPLKPGWLRDLEMEYTSSKKGYMGVYFEKPRPHLTGTAIWSGKTKSDSIARDVFCAGRNPFDSMVRPNAGIHVTHQIQHNWDLLTFTEEEHLKQIRSGVTLFHRNKDHSLIRLLREQRNGGPLPAPTPVKQIERAPAPEPPPTMPPAPAPEPEIEPVVKVKYEHAEDVTIVITSHRRPELLIAAFESCVAAGIENIVITATGVDDSMRAAFMSTANGDVKATILTHGEDVTSNQSWFRGVEACNTEYVGILHDDDLLLPDYLKHMETGIKENADVIVAQAENHECVPYLCSVDSTGGLRPTSIIKKAVSKRGGLSISPVRALFRKDDLVRWLKTAEGLPKSCYYRPDFLVGNDMLIWLQACDEYAEFWNIPHPAVSHGHWPCSTTVQDLDEDSRLFDMYDTTRDWHAHNSNLPLHIITIVLDGMPMIGSHLPILNRLQIPWHWHIIEGAAMNTHCTKWCKPQKPRLSSDGTTGYLDELKNHPRISVYRKKEWDGKQEMVNVPLPNIDHPCILMQVDCDEFWTAEQLLGIRDLFRAYPDRGHAMFWCRYFFGPHIVMSSTGCYGNSASQDWKRAWRYTPGMKFEKHEPPLMTGEGAVISQEETSQLDLVFDHYGYAYEAQVHYKERFYGYKGAVKEWKTLQRRRIGSVPLSKSLSWVPKGKSTAKVIPAI